MFKNDNKHTEIYSYIGGVASAFVKIGGILVRSPEINKTYLKLAVV